MRHAAVESLFRGYRCGGAPVVDVGEAANLYAGKLRLCWEKGPAGYSLAGGVHGHMIVSGFIPRRHILNRLIDMYCKSSCFDYARKMFDEIPQPDVVTRTTLIAAYSSYGNPKMARVLFDATPVGIRDNICYNAMITCYSHNDDGCAALKLFVDMKRDGFTPDFFSYTSVLAALAPPISDRESRCHQLHCAVIKSGCGQVTSVLNALVSVYVKCESMASARLLFDEMVHKDELSWTTIIAGYVKNDDLAAAREVFDGMDEELVVAWNAMMSGYVQKGMVSEVFGMLREMYSRGINFDDFTYTSVLSACADSELFLHGRELHGYIIKTEAKRLTSDLVVSIHNALITLYWRCGKILQAKQVFDGAPIKDLVSCNAMLSAFVGCGKLREAKRIFDGMPEKNHLSWTVMISGLAQQGSGEEALKLFNLMRLQEGLKPCDYAFAGGIISCAVLSALEQGRQLHSQLIRLGFDSSLSAGNALITMYARCGVLDDASNTFSAMPVLDSVSWNAMIAALGQHGHGKAALEYFRVMLREEIRPDRITFLTVLSACSHAGLVEEGRKCFEEMTATYGILPGEDHYARLVDLLCRAGKLTEAERVIEALPFRPGAPIWEALLSGCKLHRNMDLAVHAAERLFELIPENDGTYILLANMFATSGRWDQVAAVRKLMRDRGVKKEPGCSWLEVENKIHVFLMGDTVHPEMREIYAFLRELMQRVGKMGYVPDTSYVMHDMEREQKEEALAAHSEKLAVAYGLMKLPRGAAVRVFKNLRICGDCHDAFRFVSRAEERVIVVRDGKRFHHFRDGECSCGNYW